jgi:hypothetical protein
MRVKEEGDSKRWGSTLSLFGKIILSSSSTIGLTSMSPRRRDRILWKLFFQVAGFLGKVARFETLKGVPERKDELFCLCKAILLSWDLDKGRVVDLGPNRLQKVNIR